MLKLTAAACAALLLISPALAKPKAPPVVACKKVESVLTDIGGSSIKYDIKSPEQLQKLAVPDGVKRLVLITKPDATHTYLAILVNENDCIVGLSIVDRAAADKKLNDESI